MGCDWDIFIQARYDDKWVTVHSFETKTRCGGGPIRTGLRSVAAEHHVNGKYGIEFPTDTPFVMEERESFYEDDYNDMYRELQKLEEFYDEKGALKPNVTLPTEKKRKNGEEKSEATPLSPQEVLSKRSSLNEKMKTIENRCKAAGKIGRYPAHHCFIMSQQDFDKFIVLVPKGEYPCYNKLLRPLGLWTEMLKTADPFKEGNVLDDDTESIERITKDIEALQTARQEGANLAFSNLAVLNRKYPLPTALNLAIREYLTPPAAKDMRIAIFDDERNSKAIREGNLSEPQCVIM